MITHYAEERRNSINEPMFRNAVTSDMKSGKSIYYVLGENRSGERVEFQIVSKLNGLQVETSSAVKSLAAECFNQRYHHSAGDFVLTSSRINDIDEVDTSMLYNLK